MRVGELVPSLLCMFVQEALLQELRDGKRHWLDKARTLPRLEQAVSTNFIISYNQHSDH